MKIALDDIKLYREGYCYWCPLFNRGSAVWVCRAGFYPESAVSPLMNGLNYQRDPECIKRFGE